MGVLWVRDPALRDEIADRHERVETFRNGPRKTFLFRFILYISRSHIDGEEVACDLDVSHLTDLVYVVDYNYVIINEQ